ncbi:6-bladed beta-propeller, partial [Planctomycetota bacterium]
MFLERRNSFFVMVVSVITLLMTSYGFANYQYLNEWGSLGTGDGQFNNPTGLAFDQSGNVYVSDQDNHRIQKFTGNGEYITQWGDFGTGEGQFNMPVGITTDSSGNVYVADVFNDRIQKFSSNGEYISQWGSLGSGSGEFNKPFDVEIDSLNNIYVADLYNHLIQKFTSDGSFITMWGEGGKETSQFLHTVGIAIDSSDYIYVSDHDNNRIQKFSSDGSFVDIWGGIDPYNGGGANIGSGDGQFDHQVGIAADENDNILVADTDNSRIQVFTDDGTFIDKWGSYGTGTGLTPNYVPHLIRELSAC